MFFQKSKIILIICTVLAAALPFFASARGLVPCGGYEADNVTREHPCGVEDIFVLIAKLTNFLIAVAGMYAVYKIIDGGFGLITSIGNEESITAKKGEITNAVVGLVLVFMAFMLINTVVNGLLTRSIVTGKKECALDLTKPLTYLRIDENACSNLPHPDIHTGN